MTRDERTLWNELRGRRFEGVKYRRQHPIDRWIADFARVERRLVIELDGPVHEGRQAEDGDRTEELRARGFTVLRFANESVREDLPGVLETIRAALEALPAAFSRKPSP